MKLYLKKAVGVLLCFVILFGMFGIIGYASNATPIIYVADIENNTLYLNCNSATAEPVFLPEQSKLEEYFLNIVFGILAATVAEETEFGMKYLRNGVNGLLSDAVCNEYGDTQNKVGVNTYKYPLSYYVQDETVMTDFILSLGTSKSSPGLEHIYLFTYDWRLDPLENAALLSDYIAYVKTREEVNKVALLGAGYGGVVVHSYLWQYANEAASDVSSCVFLNSPLLGNSLIGDFMSGNLAKKMVNTGTILNSYESISATERADALVRYINDDADGMIVGLFEDVFGSGAYVSQLSTGLVWIVNAALGGQDIWSDMAKTYNAFLTDGEEQLYSSSLKNFLRYAPGLWALVPNDFFYDAWYFMFPDDEASTKLTKKVNDYRTVLATTAETLQNAQASGININVVAGYNLQILPIAGVVDEHSDCMLLTKYASAGAITAEHGSDEVLAQAVNHEHGHLSPDSQIDASTCALPENTWFISNLPNMQFESETASDFVMWLLSSSRLRTIWEDPTYPQYMQYTRSDNKIAAVKNNNAAYFYGDANTDGYVNSADARLTLRYSVGLESIPAAFGLTLADVNTDGVITAADARIILRFSVGIYDTTVE